VLRELLGRAGANVQCLDLAWHYFGPDNVKVLEHLGNRRANEKYERKEGGLKAPKPTPTSDLTARRAWMKAKYEDLQHLRSYHGYLNVTVVIRGSKKKLLWERRYVKLHENSLEIFTKEDDPAPPIDSLDVGSCTVKEFNELDSWILPLKDKKIDSKIAFELITPKKIYVFNSSSSPGLYEWVHTFRVRPFTFPHHLSCHLFSFLTRSFYFFFFSLSPISSLSLSLSYSSSHPSSPLLLDDYRTKSNRWTQG
jgi:hypothetical protein